MARPKHLTIPGAAYFITTNTWERRAMFIKPPWAEVVETKLFAYRDQGEYRVHAYVVMPDHLHVLLTPSPAGTLERAAQLIKGGASHEIGLQFGTKFPAWQPGFTSHAIQREEDFRAHVAYIDQNPVKRGLVARAEDYAFSSANGKHTLDPWSPLRAGPRAGL